VVWNKEADRTLSYSTLQWHT